MANSFQEAKIAAEQLLSDITAKVDTLNQKLIQSATLINKIVTTNVGNNQDSVKKNISAIDQEIQKQKELEKELRASAEARRKLVVARKNDIQANIKQQALEQKSRESLQKQREAATQLGRAYNQLISRQKDAKNSLRDLIAEGKRAGQSQRAYNRELATAQNRYDKLTNKVNQANKATSNFSKTGLGGAVRGVRNLIAAFGVIGGVTLFASVVKDAFDLTKKLDSMAFSMRAVIKDSYELSVTNEFLRQTAQDYGADLLTLTNRYIKFRAATQQAGLTAEETQKIFGTMAKAAGVLGLKKDELQGIFLALEQMVSKGKVTTEELRRQLGERLPGAMDIMATALGKTTAELDEMLKKGEVITKDVLPAFARQVEIAFGLDKVKKVETLQAATTRLENAWMILIQDFNEGNKASGALMVVFDFLATNLATILEVVVKLGVAFGVYKAVMIATSLITKLYNADILYNIGFQIELQRQTIRSAFATKSLGKAMLILGRTMLTNPIFLTIAALGALYFAFKDAGKGAEESAEEMTKVNKELTETNKAAADTAASVKTLVGRYEELTDKAKKLGGETKLAADEQKELRDIIRQIGEVVPDAVTKLNAYNVALEIGAEAAKKWVKNQEELVLSKANDVIREQTDLLNKQKEVLVRLDGLKKGTFTADVAGFAELRRLEDGRFEALKKGTNQYVILKGKEHTAALQGIADAQEDVIKSKNLIEANEDIITSITGIEKPRQKEARLLKEATALKEKEAKAIADEVDVIAEWEAEIKSLNTTLSNLRAENILAKETEEILATIKAIDDLQAKIDALLPKEKKTGSKKKKNRKEIELNELEAKSVNSLVAEVQKQISIYEEVLSITPKMTKEYEYLEEQIKNLKDALEGIDVTDAMTEIEEWSDDFSEAQKKALERLKALKKELNDFFQGFKDDFFSDAGFDRLNEIFLTFDKEGFSQFQRLLEAAPDDKKWAVWANSIMEVAQEAFNFINKTQQASFDAQYERLAQQKDIALMFAGESAAAREEIERQYEAKRRAVQKQQARAQKDQALFNIAIDTAQAIVATLGEAGVAGIPLSLIVGAIGAAQLAMVAATPVPEFFRGTMNSPEGWAMVDEKRPEVHTDNKGNIKSTGEGKANKRWLERGDKIYSSREEYFKKELSTVLGGNDILPYNQMFDIAPVMNIEQGIKKQDFVREIRSLKSAIETKEGTNISIDKNGFAVRHTKNGHTKDIQNNILRLKKRVV